MSTGLREALAHIRESHPSTKRYEDAFVRVEELFASLQAELGRGGHAKAVTERDGGSALGTSAQRIGSPAKTPDPNSSGLVEEVETLRERSDELRLTQTELTEALRARMPAKEMSLLSKYLFAIGGMEAEISRLRADRLTKQQAADLLEVLTRHPEAVQEVSLGTFPLLRRISEEGNPK